VTTAGGLQIAEFAQALRPAFAGDLQEVAVALSDWDQFAFLAVRSVLLSAALVTASGTAGTLLPVHELNTLYRYREKLEATGSEIHVLFRSLLGDSLDLRPGWFWLRDYDFEAVTANLMVEALTGNDPASRARSFEILRHARSSIFTVRDDILERSLREIPAELYEAAWAHLVDVATAEDLSHLRAWALGTWLEPRIEWLEAFIESGRELDTFLARGPDPLLFPEYLQETIIDQVSHLSERTLQVLSTTPAARLSDAAKAEATRRVAWTEFGQAKKHGSLEPFAAHRVHDLQVAPNSEADEQTYERLREKETGEIEGVLDWYAPDGAEAYRILAERGKIPREIVRQDLLSGFARVRDESDRRLDEARGTQIAQIFREGFDKYRGFIARTFTAAALAALSPNPTPEDAPIARTLLNDHLTRTNALRVLAREGDAEDLSVLIEVASSSYGDERKLALEGVRRLAGNNVDVARVLLASDTRQIRHAALEILQPIANQGALPLLEELLLDEDGDLRIAALQQLERRLSRDELAERLRSYVENDRYFYNVATWLDRLIYAPAPLSDYYRTALKTSVEKRAPSFSLQYLKFPVVINGIPIFRRSGCHREAEKQLRDFRDRRLLGISFRIKGFVTCCTLL
jgi:hypothetical protein